MNREQNLNKASANYCVTYSIHTQTFNYAVPTGYEVASQYFAMSARLLNTIITSDNGTDMFSYLEACIRTSEDDKGRDQGMKMLGGTYLSMMSSWIIMNRNQLHNARQIHKKEEEEKLKQINQLHSAITRYEEEIKQIEVQIKDAIQVLAETVKTLQQKLSDLKKLIADGHKKIQQLTTPLAFSIVKNSYRPRERESDVNATQLEQLIAQVFGGKTNKEITTLLEEVLERRKNKSRY